MGNCVMGVGAAFYSFEFSTLLTVAAPFNCKILRWLADSTDALEADSVKL